MNPFHLFDYLLGDHLELGVERFPKGVLARHGKDYDRADQAFKRPPCHIIHRPSARCRLGRKHEFPDQGEVVRGQTIEDGDLCRLDEAGLRPKEIDARGGFVRRNREA